MLHICMVSTGYDSMLPERIGAVEQYAYGLSKELSNGNSVDVFAFGVGNQETQTLRIQTVNYGKPVLKALKSLIGTQSAYGVLFSLKLFRKVSRLQKLHPIDIIHLHNPLTGPVASFFKFSCHTPVVCSIHGPIRSSLPISMCDRILTVSDFMKNYLSTEKGIKWNKIDVLPVGIDTDVFKPVKSKEQAKKELGLGGFKVILFVGRKCPEKGPQMIVKALPLILKRIPDALAVFVGADYWHGVKSTTFTESLRLRAKKLKVDNHVVFKGRVPEDVLRCYYNAADAYVMPALWNEPFGTVLIEAMAYEKPVIATTMGGIREIISSGKNGILVDPNNLEELVDAVANTLTDVEYAELLGKNGRKTVQERYSYKIVARRCLEIYEKVLSN